MKIIIEDDISYLEAKGYNITFWLSVCKKIKINQSIKIKVTANGAAKARANLDATIKRKNINQKYSFKRADNECYRVWRVS